jgi:hypothetical protein
MIQRLAPSVLLLLGLTTFGCHGSDKNQVKSHTDSRASASPTATQPSTFTGTLTGSAVAVGGETTGWRLAGDGQTGGIDVDVSKVLSRAKALDGKRVAITGRMTSRTGPERGKVQVLVADSIEPAPAPKTSAGVKPS